MNYKNLKKVEDAITTMIIILVSVCVMMVSTHVHHIYGATVKPKAKRKKAYRLVVNNKLLNHINKINNDNSNKLRRKEMKTLAEKGLAKVYASGETWFVKKNKAVIYSKPNESSEKLGTYSYRDAVDYYTTSNPSWVAVKVDNAYGYMQKTKLSIKKPELPYTQYRVVGDKRKSYMDYRTITAKDTPQWKLQHQKAYTSSDGIRKVGQRFCIAVGSAYTKNIGQRIDIILNNGKMLKCILSDQKKNCDTNSDHTIGADGGAVEFLVDTGAMSSKMKKMGDVGFSKHITTSNVKEIRVYKYAL